MQPHAEGRGRGRGGGRGASRGGRGLRDSAGRGGARGRGGSRGNGRGRGRGQPAGTSLGVQKGGKLRSLKNQIRGVERLLRKEDIEPRARTKQAALLEQLKAAMAQHDQSELERKYAVRYHKIRFFERVKLERQIKQAQRGIADGPPPEELPQMERQLAKLHEDLQYVLHFPKGEKYVSITKEVEEPAAAAALEAEHTRLRALVARQLAEVAMVTEADEGASLQAAAAAAATQSAAGNAAVESDEDDFFLPDNAPDGDDSDGREEPAAGVSAPETSEPAPEPAPVSALQPPLKRQRGGRAVALRAAAKEASQAYAGHAQQAGKLGKSAEARCAGAAVNAERRTPTAASLSERGSIGAKYAPGAPDISKTERRKTGTGRAAAPPHSLAARSAGQQRPPAKAAWVPRGLAQQKQQLKYEKSTPVSLQTRQAPSLASDAAGSAAAEAEKAPLRKRAEGGRKRRK